MVRRERRFDTTGGNDLAAAQKQRMCRRRWNVLDVVNHHHGRERRTLGRESTEGVQEELAAGEIETCCRLVEEEQLRRGQQRTREQESHPLAVGAV
jgi:hypothetical protein